MFKKAFTSAIIFLFAIQGFAFQTAGEWQKLVPDDKSFSVLMPAAWEKNDSKKDSEVGPVVSQIWIAKMPNGDYNNVYLVGVTDYPIDLDPKSELDADRDKFLEAIKATLVSSTDITVGKIPGKEFVGKTDTHTFKSVVFLIGRRAYQAAAGELTANMDENRVEKFLGSFELAQTS